MYCNGLYRHPGDGHYLLETCREYYQSFIYSPTDALVCCLKKISKFALKFTLKQLRHVPVLQLRHHQGAN